MNTEEEKKPKSFWKEKMMRLKIVVLIRKNIFLFSLLLVFSLSLLLGFWNITKHEVINIDGEDIDRSIFLEIEKYFDENISSFNYFLFSPKEHQKNMYSNIAEVKKVRIEKVLPNKVVLFVEIHQPKYVVELLSDQCFVLSPGGFVLHDILEEDTEIPEQFCINYATENSLIYFASTDMEISVLEDGKKRLLLMEDINRVVEVVETFNYKIVNITLESGVLKIFDEEGKEFTFSLADDISTQLKRFIVVIGKIKNDLLEFGSLDLRFERPVMRE